MEQQGQNTNPDASRSRSLCFELTATLDFRQPLFALLWIAVPVKRIRRVCDETGIASHLNACVGEALDLAIPRVCNVIAVRV